jgi:hypothetical protein
MLSAICDAKLLSDSIVTRLLCRNAAGLALYTVKNDEVGCRRGSPSDKLHVLLLVATHFGHATWDDEVLRLQAGSGCGALVPATLWPTCRPGVMPAHDARASLLAWLEASCENLKPT